MTRPNVRSVVLAAALAVGASGTVSGCSAVKIAYTYLDTLIEGWVERYFALDASQEELAERQIDRFVVWHRSTMLPKYADYLRDEAAIHEAGRFSRASYQQSSKRVDALYRETVGGAIPFITDFLMTQRSRPKLRHIQEQMAERNAELMEKFSRPREEVLEERVQQTVDTFEYLMGDLEEFQIELLRQRGRQMKWDQNFWMTNRRRHQAAFISFMTNQPEPKDISEFLEPWLLDPNQFRDPSYRPHSEATRAAIESMIYDVLASMTPEQRSTLVESLRDLASDLSDLRG